MFYINAASTLSHQPSFMNPGFSASLVPLSGEEMMQPVAYKDYIEGNLLRRMSRILRMGVVCAKECLKTDHNLEKLIQPDAILVGTGLGCLADTEKFLNTYLTVEGMLPPTSFIQSTHNTIAGQISLTLGNHSYNMTHTQNSLSFEHAMLDGMVGLTEGKGDLLVGGADEKIELLDTVAEAFDFSEFPLSTGVSFFRLSSRKNEETLGRVADVEVVTGVQDPEKALHEFLSGNNCAPSDISKIFYQAPRHDYLMKNKSGMPGEWINSIAFSGLYATASAFAFHMALDEMSRAKDHCKILIYNHLNPNNLGLVLLESVEA